MKIKIGEFVLLACSIASCLTIFCLMLDASQPEYYFTLIIMPMVFFLTSLVFSKVYNLFLKNLAVSIIIALLFFRMVVSPLLMCLGDYSVTITKNIDKNMFKAILLVSYECIAIFGALYYFSRKKSKDKTQVTQDRQVKYYERAARKRLKIYRNLLLLVAFALMACYIITPELAKGYRTILQANDPAFTQYEDSYLVSEYGTTFLKKFSLVTGTYLMRACTIIFPAYFVIIFSQKKGALNNLFAWIMCFVPLLFVGGAIARSLIYFVILLMLKIFCNPKEESLLRIFLILIIAVLFIIVWWLFRLNVTESSENVFSAFSKRISAYFSGVNIVSGVFNLPGDLKYRVRYFCYDYIGSMPYSNTLFGISHMRIAPFFNLYNESSGQIPTTIGMGYYYFGPLFAPLYSVAFAVIAYKAAENLNHSTNPFRYMRYLLTLVYFSMGIVMYNIEITMTTYFCIILPAYIIERLAWGKNDNYLLKAREKL